MDVEANERGDCGFVTQPEKINKSRCIFFTILYVLIFIAILGIFIRLYLKDGNTGAFIVGIFVIFFCAVLMIYLVYVCSVEPQTFHK